MYIERGGEEEIERGGARKKEMERQRAKERGRSERDTPPHTHIRTHIPCKQDKNGAPKKKKLQRA